MLVNWSTHAYCACAACHSTACTASSSQPNAAKAASSPSLVTTSGCAPPSAAATWPANMTRAALSAMMTTTTDQSSSSTSSISSTNSYSASWRYFEKSKPTGSVCSLRKVWRIAWNSAALRTSTVVWPTSSVSPSCSPRLSSCVGAFSIAWSSRPSASAMPISAIAATTSTTAPMKSSVCAHSNESTISWLSSTTCSNIESPNESRPISMSSSFTWVSTWFFGEFRSPSALCSRVRPCSNTSVNTTSAKIHAQTRVDGAAARGRNLVVRVVLRARAPGTRPAAPCRPA